MNADRPRTKTTDRPSMGLGGLAREKGAAGLSRRGFLGGAAALGGVALLAASRVRAGEPNPAGTALPAGAPLRVKPVLVYQLYQRAARTSWRGYGGLKSQDDVAQEAKRIEAELRALAAKADFPMEIQPLALVGNGNESTAAAATDSDTLLVYASGGAQGWLEQLAASKKPNVMFLRHKSGPIYLWYEIAHWRLLRKSEDTFREPNLDLADIVVDDYDGVLWRLRALYGLKNAKGTKCVAIGGLQSYSAPGQRCGPAHVKEVWGYEIRPVPDPDVIARLQKARADANAMAEATRQADALLAQPNVTLQTDKKFVVNSFLALRVFKEIMAETGATNLGVANCMGSLIGVLDTPPCLVLSLLNDEGLTAFCHTDYTHTPPGVLLRWISGKPSFVSNSHFPHHGLLTLAHCAAPRRMNGRDFEPAKILTHFESDYGAATKVEYRKGQVITNLIPNLTCTKWLGFRGKILDSPAYDVCRSQIDLEIEGDWRRLLRDMQGFHTVTCYGDYLREIGYALRKVGITWENISETA